MEDILVEIMYMEVNEASLLSKMPMWTNQMYL